MLLSQSLGDHEVEREAFSRTHGLKGESTGSQLQHARERVVLPFEIASLPDLTGYLAFAGDYPIARVMLEYVRFRNRVPAIEERTSC